MQWLLLQMLQMLHGLISQYVACQSNTTKTTGFELFHQSTGDFGGRWSGMRLDLQGSAKYEFLKIIRPPDCVHCPCTSLLSALHYGANPPVHLDK